MDKYKLAEWMHDEYERLAKAENWQTQEITRVKFEDLPAENKSTMLALADKMLKTFSIISLNPPVIKSVCDHDYVLVATVSGHDFYQCSKCGEGG